MSRVLVVDYGVGNLHSLAKALGRGGHDVRIERSPATFQGVDAVVLPGVGAFGAAAAAFAPCAPAFRAAIQCGLACLGICLGMQLLFEQSEEGGGPGLGLLPGSVRRLRAARIPHMGWNAVEPGPAPDALFGTAPLVAYYANSYVAEPADDSAVIAWTQYDGERFPAAVRRGRVWGVQFHPEKSGEAGLRVLGNFLAQAGAS